MTLRSLKISLGLCVSLMAAACMQESGLKESLFTHQSSEPFFDHTDHPNRKFIGMTREELVARIGEPDGIIHATLLGGPPSVALVYAPFGKDKCINAFIITLKDEIVRKYFCR